MQEQDLGPSKGAGERLRGKMSRRTWDLHGPRLGVSHSSVTGDDDYDG